MISQVPSIIRLFDARFHPDFPLGVIIADAAMGIIALGLTIVLAFFTGGLSFFAPWIFWGGVTLFLCGLFRSDGPISNIWIRAICVSLPWIIIILLWAQGDRLLIVMVSVGTILPTAGGLWVHRAYRKRQPR